MDRIKTILAPTDFSELSLIGLRHALELAQSQGAQVIVYNVADYREVIPYQERSTPHFNHVEEFLNYRRNRIDKFLRKVFPDLITKVKVRQEVEIGVAHEQIVEKAADVGVDMIVMSTHGRTGLLHMLMGSIAEQVVRRATCPVITVRSRKEVGLTEIRAA